MLKTDTNKPSIAHGTHNQQKSRAQQSEITDESLNSIMTLLRTQAIQYKDAGLTQVSNWL